MVDAKASRWTAEAVPDQTGRTFLVTGANSGLGYAMTRQLVRRGAHVIMAVRNEEKGVRARAALTAEQPGARLDVRRLDLADLDSVQSFASAVIADGQRINVLVNNAGIMMPPRSLSPQGFESQFASNHLGHFALTGRLLSALHGRDPRVVTVSSNLHRQGHIHFDDLTGAREYSPTGFYAQSKFANVLFGLELDRRLRAAGLPIKSIIAHPGYTATNLHSSLDPKGPMKFAIKLGNVLYAQRADMGALDQLYAATEPRAESGQFIGPDGLGERRGHPTIVQPVEAAKDPETARRLWQLSEELTGVHFDFDAARPA